MALQSNRKDDFMLLSTVYPEYSIKINTLSHFYLEDEVISNVMSGVPSDDQFFYKTGYEITSVIVRSIMFLKKMRNKPRTITFREIYDYMGFEKLKELKELMSSYEDSEAQTITSMAVGLLEGDVEYYGKISRTVRTTLTQLITGNLGKVIGNAKYNKLIDRLENDKGVILVVHTGAMLQGEAALTLGKLTINSIQNLVGRYFTSGRKFATPLCLYLDELSNLLYFGIEDMYNKAGGCECYITGFTQSPADVEAVLGADKARKLFDNTNTKIVMRINDIESADMLIEYGGTTERTTSQLSLNGGIRSTEVKENTLEKTNLLRLKPREFYYFGFEGSFFGKTAPTQDQNVKVIFPNVVEDKDQ